MLITNTPNSELHIYDNEGNEVVTVNDNGIIKGVHPVSKEETTLFDGAVTTVGDADTEPIVAFSGTAEEFSELYVCVNNERLVYNTEYQSFDDANETVSVLLTDGYIKIFAYNSGTFAIIIKQSTTTVDEGFVEAVQSVVYDNDDAVITLRSEAISEMGWHVVQINSTEVYAKLKDAEDAFNAWASKPNRRIVVVTPVELNEETADVAITMSPCCAVNQTGRDKFDIFFGTFTFPVMGSVVMQIYAFPFVDIIEGGFGIILQCAIKVERVVASNPEVQN